MEKTIPQINCSIFLGQELRIKWLTEKIDTAQSFHEKVRWAKDLLMELDPLVTCTAYNRKSEECSNCRSFSHLRRQALLSVLEKAKLAKIGKTMMKQVSILVVDDVEGILDLFRRALSAEGYRVLTASDGQEALNIVKEGKPDLVILDIRMPHLDGMETFRRLRKIDHNLIVIILTAYATLESARRALRLGAYDYITKPFHLDYVRAVIEDALKHGNLPRTQ